MVQALALIVILHLAGTVIADALSLPVPGPVIGLVGLFFLLRTGRVPVAALERVAGALIPFLPLFFVPAGAGLVLHLKRIGTDGLGIALALLPGTLIALAATAWLFTRLTRPMGVDAGVSQGGEPR
ncbi:MAG: CidA/LrgA family protein [Alphaproteobacteria bacterium]